MDCAAGRDLAGARRGPGITAGQVREVIECLIGAGQWQDGVLDVQVVPEDGYDAPRIAHLLADLPIEVLGRLRSNRVMRKPAPVPWVCPPQGARPSTAVSSAAAAPRPGARWRW
ncbi:transposase [Streptomyces virginiae]|uniref:transposase n=1 Tax=Streptomyces virginiae TaxID=1961 RepID=UPI00068E6EF6